MSNTDREALEQQLTAVVNRIAFEAISPHWKEKTCAYYVNLLKGIIESETAKAYAKGAQTALELCGKVEDDIEWRKALKGDSHE